MKGHRGAPASSGGFTSKFLPAVCLLGLLALGYLYFDLNQQKLAVDGTLRSTEAQLQELKAKYHTLDEDRRDLSATFETCRREKQQQHEAADAEIRTLKEELNTAKIGKDAAEKSLEDSKSQVDSLKTETANCEKENQRLGEERDQCKTALEDAGKQHGSSVATLEEQVKVLGEEKEKAIKAGTAVEGELASLKVKAGEREAACVALAGALEKAVEEKKALVGKISEMQSAANVALAASVVGGKAVEAVQTGGVGGGVGGTGVGVAAQQNAGVQGAGAGAGVAAAAAAGNVGSVGGQVDVVASAGSVAGAAGGAGAGGVQSQIQNAAGNANAVVSNNALGGASNSVGGGVGVAGSVGGSAGAGVAAGVAGNSAAAGAAVAPLEDKHAVAAPPGDVQLAEDAAHHLNAAMDKERGAAVPDGSHAVAKAEEHVIRAP